MTTETHCRRLHFPAGASLRGYPGTGKQNVGRRGWIQIVPHSARRGWWLRQVSLNWIIRFCFSRRIDGITASPAATGYLDLCPFWRAWGGRHPYRSAHGPNFS